VNRAVTLRQPEARAGLRAAYHALGYEVIPFKHTEEAVLAHVPGTCG